MKKLLLIINLCFIFSAYSGEDPTLIPPIDGGGIRGIIPARLLAQTEKYLESKHKENTVINKKTDDGLQWDEKLKWEKEQVFKTNSKIPNH